MGKWESLATTQSKSHTHAICYKKDKIVMMKVTRYFG